MVREGQGWPPTPLRVELLTLDLQAQDDQLAFHELRVVKLDK